MEESRDGVQEPSEQIEIDIALPQNSADRRRAARKRRKQQIRRNTAPAAPVPEQEEKGQTVEIPSVVAEEAAKKPDRAAQRAAIAKARAIRKEAAAKEREEKRRAAAEALALVSGTHLFRRRERKNPVVPQSSVSTNTGVFRWLEAIRKSQEKRRDPQPQDNDTLVAELAAEKQAFPQQSAPAADVDAIVAEIAAEQNGSAAPEESVEIPISLDEGAEPAEIVEAIAAALGTPEPAAEPAGAEAAPAPEVSAPAAPAAEPVIAGSGQVVDRIIEKLAAENPPEPEKPEAPKMTYVEAITAAMAQNAPQQPEPEPEAPEVPADPLRKAFDAEARRHQEKRDAAFHAKEMEAAAEQYRLDTVSAKPFVRKLSRKTGRTWRREAASEQAKALNPRIRRAGAHVNIAVCMVMLFGIAAGMLIFERPTVSEIENRTLAKMPAFSLDGYLSGEYTNGVAEYYNDTVPFRSVFKNITASIRQHMGLSKDDAVLHNGVPTVDPDANVTTAATSDVLAEFTVTRMTETTEPTEPDEPQDDEGELGGSILVVNKRGIPLYGGSYAVGENYARYLNSYQEALGDGVQVWSMVVPTPCSFYTPEKYQNLIGSERGNINHINEHFKGVLPVDAYTPLEKHASEPIFMRTDHHWSALGAFYAAEEFAKTARVPFAPMTDYDKVVKEGYVGTLYGYSQDITLKNNPEDFFYYVPHAAYDVTYYNTSLGGKRAGSLLINLDRVQPVSWYLVYMGTDEIVTHVTTQVKNGRKLAVIKDSYGNALIPWLTSSFEEITVIDMRYFKVNVIDYLKQIGATDVLFAMNTFSATGGNCKAIDRLRRQ